MEISESKAHEYPSDELIPTREILNLLVSKHGTSKFPQSKPKVDYPSIGEAFRPAEVVLDIPDECSGLPKTTSEADKDGVKALSVHLASGDVHKTVPSQSNSQSEEICCRICQEEDTNEKLISPCFCQGSIGFMHFSCLERWLQTNRRAYCELCSYRFNVETVMPSAGQFFRNPTQNMDMPSFICDVSCFFLLTPLLIASTYLCCTRLTYYQGSAKSETTFAIATLIISLITVYSAWAALAVLYHRRVWLVWRERNSKIRLMIDSSESGLPEKILNNKAERKLGATTHGRQGVTSRDESSSVLLQPTSVDSKELISKSSDAWSI